MHRLYHALLLLEINLMLFIVWIYSLVSGRKIAKASKQKILALPYYSHSYAGGHSRIGDWKPLFESKGIDYEVHWASHNREFVSELLSDNWLLKYRFYHRVLVKRFFIIFTLYRYQAVWIQRAFIPFYPFKDAYFEKLLCAIHPNVVIDFYDADYESNYQLTLNSARHANKVSVASMYLVDFFKTKGIATCFVRFAMNYAPYKTHRPASNNQQLVIGWMGAPDNFLNVLQIEPILKAIENKYDFVSFHFICRQISDTTLKRVKVSKWGDEGFDYYEAIATFDIGIAPMLNATERDKARTAFKTLEYMAAAIPFVTSPWGVPDKLEDGKNALFALNESEWLEKLIFLIENRQQSMMLGNEARNTLIEFYTYDKVYNELHQVLLG